MTRGAGFVTMEIVIHNVRKNIMKNSPALNELTRLGLTVYEARTYAALLAHPGAKAAVLARAAGIPQPHIYRTLRRLLDMGLATRSARGRTVYTPVEPARALATLEGELKRRRAAEDRALTAAHSILATLYAEGRGEGAPEELVEIIKNEEEVLARVRAMESSARRRVVSFNKPPYIRAAGRALALKRLYRPTLEALRHGARVQALFEEGDGLPPHRDLEFLSRFGEEFRVVRRLPMKLVVVDGRDVMLALESAAPEGAPTTTYLAIRHRALAETLEALFDKLWADGKPLAFKG